MITATLEYSSNVWDRHVLLIPNRPEPFICQDNMESRYINALRSGFPEICLEVLRECKIAVPVDEVPSVQHRSSGKFESHSHLVIIVASYHLNHADEDLLRKIVSKIKERVEMAAEAACIGYRLELHPIVMINGVSTDTPTPAFT